MFRYRRLLGCAILLITVLISSGCDQGSSITAPSGSIITVDEDTYTLADGRGYVSEDYKDFTILIEDLNGDQMNNIELYIDSPFVRMPEQYIWFEVNDEKVFDAISPTTDEAGGYQLRVGFKSGQGTTYTAVIEILSGSAAHATITLNIS